MGESNSELRVRINGHRYAINNKTDVFCVIHGSSRTCAEKTKIFPNPSLDNNDFILIEKNPTTGWYTQDKINRLNPEIFGMDTLGTLYPGSLNKKRYEDVIKPNKNDEAVSFTVPF